MFMLLGKQHQSATVPFCKRVYCAVTILPHKVHSLGHLCGLLCITQFSPCLLYAHTLSDLDYTSSLACMQPHELPNLLQKCLLLRTSTS